MRHLMNNIQEPAAAPKLLNCFPSETNVYSPWQIYSIDGEIPTGLIQTAAFNYIEYGNSSSTVLMDLGYILCSVNDERLIKGSGS